MPSLIIGIGECRVSRTPGNILVTHGLGSCIAIVIYDPVERVAGLLHYMLPESSLDGGKAKQQPFLFADTGIPLLFRRACQLGAAKTRMVVMAAGGARMLDPGGTFNIGQRNRMAMRKMLWKLGVTLHREETGGTVSRTVSIDVSTGRVLLRTQGELKREMSIAEGGPCCH